MTREYALVPRHDHSQVSLLRTASPEVSTESAHDPHESQAEKERPLDPLESVLANKSSISGASVVVEAVTGAGFSKTTEVEQAFFANRYRL